MTGEELLPSIVAAIVVCDGKVLLVRRRVAEGPLSWQFPAGEQELGETAEEAAVRETWEEVGLSVRAVKNLGERIHPVTGRKMSYVGCNVVSGSPTLMNTDELADLTWCEVSEAEGYLPAGVSPSVLEYIRKGAGE